MKVCGIIAEYNPLHNGHAYQLNYVREKPGADFIIVCMSGDFVQRGAPAILDKYARTRMALSAGADLVLELPAANACGSAEFFASAGVSLLDSVGVTDYMSFGCEAFDGLSDSESFLEAAGVLNNETPEYRDLLHKNLSRGMTFPEARRTAIAETSPRVLPFIGSPNNILGVEYCRCLLKLNSRIVPFPLPRFGNSYLSEELDEQGFSSAAAIRKHLANSGSEVISGELLRSMPEECAYILSEYAKNSRLVFPGDFDRIMLYQLMKENPQSIVQYQDVDPELGRRILRLRNQYVSFESFSALVKSRNYTLTRVSRALLHILLGIREINRSPGYARILGFRKSSSALLTELRKKSRIPLISRPSDFSFLYPEERADYEITVLASNLYESQACLKESRPFIHEFQRPVILLP